MAAYGIRGTDGKSELKTAWLCRVSKRILEGGGGDETYGLGSLDFHRFLGLGIAAHAGVAIDGLEGAEADELHWAFIYTLSDGLKHGVQRFGSGSF